MPSALLLLGLGLGPPPPGVAPDPAYTLRWTAPSSCPAEPEIVERIEELLASGARTPVHVAAEGTVVHEQDRWTLTLRISTESGSRARTVESTDCDELASVAALLIAIAIDPGLARGPLASPVGPSPVEPPVEPPPVEPPPVEPPPVEPPPNEPAASAPTEPEAPPPAAEAPHLTLQGSALAAVGSSVGVLPSIAPTLRLGGGLRSKWLRLEALAVYRLPRRTLDGRAELWTLAGDVRGCGVPRARGVLFPLCVGVEVGAIAGRSFDVSSPGRGRAPWLALHAGGGLVAILSRRVGLAIDANLLIPTVRAGFEIEGIGELHRVSAVGFDANVALEVAFP